MSNRWILGARLRTLPAAIIPVFLGTAEAFQEGVVFWRFLLTLFLAVNLQLAVNFANDFSDGIRGSDDINRVGPTRLVGSGLASSEEVMRATKIFFTLSILAGFVIALVTSFYLLGVGVLCILAAWFYTGGKKPYGYNGFGEISVFIFFGLVATVGTFFIQTQSFSMISLVSGSIAGFLSCSLLSINNIRDYQNDRKNGKKTVAVRIGRKNSRRIYCLIIFLAIFLALLISIWRPWALLTIFCLPLALRSCQVAISADDYETWDKALKLTALVQVTVGVLLSLGLAV